MNKASFVPVKTLVVATLGLTLLAAAPPCIAQQPGKVYRIAWLGVNAPLPTDTNSRQCPISGTAFWQTWVKGMRTQGFIESQNLVTACRYTEGQPERAPVNAAELIRISPDLFLANGTANVRAVQQATRTIPILMHGVINPVGRGVVASLAHPGGNTTGITDEAGPQIAGKYLQLLKEAAPRITRVALLLGPLNPLEPDMRYGPELEAAARPLGVTLHRYRAQTPDEFADAFTAMTRAGDEAVLIVPHPLFGGNSNLRRLARLALDHRFPSIADGDEFTELGGLLGYGRSAFDAYRLLPLYAAKLLNGANPGDLPVEQPTKYELRANLKTARSLGLTMPGTLLIQADEVIR